MVDDRGNDVSEYQGDVDFTKVPGKFIYHRLWNWRTGAERLDAKVARNVAAADEAGKISGGYLRVNAPLWTPVQAANKLINLAEDFDLLAYGRLIPCVDIEFTGLVNDYLPAQYKLWTAQFFLEWEDIGYSPEHMDLMVYSSGSYFNALMPPMTEWPDWAHCWVGHTKKFTANPNQYDEEWAGKTPYTFDGRTKIHQYSTTGRVPGIAGDVDLDALMPGVTLESITIRPREAGEGGNGGGGAVVATPKPNFIERNEWGAAYEDGYDDASLPATELFAHHSVAGYIQPNAGRTAECAYMRKLDIEGHNQFKSGISYTFVMFPSGTIGVGHSLDRAGAHTINHNYTGRAICYPGNYMNDVLTQAQKDSTAQLIKYGREQGWWTNDKFTGGHRDVYATLCPGDNVYKELPNINRLSSAPNPASSGGTDDDMGLTPEQDARLTTVYNFLGLTAGAPINPDTGKPMTLFEVMWGVDELTAAKVAPMLKVVTDLQQRTHDSLLGAIKAIPTTSVPGTGGGPAVQVVPLTVVTESLETILKRLKLQVISASQGQ